MQAPLAINAKNIDLWLTFYRDVSDGPTQRAMRELLSIDEREKEKSFYFADDSLRYLATRAMVRTVLSRYSAVDPADWIFSQNGYGRPEIANLIEENATGLCFNISHTAGLIALGVTRQRALGIDVERPSARPGAQAIAECFFSPAEAAELSSVPDSHRQDRFCEYWTFKESYIKARGMGLSIPLDQFSFHYPDRRTVQITIDPRLDDDESRWSFWQCRPTPEYLLAICAGRLSAQASVLTIRQIVPTVSEEAVSVEWLKTSCGTHQPQQA